MEARACDLAEYLLANNATVRAAAKQFGVSKSTVHKDLTERLEKIDPALYQQVRQLLDRNKAERHIRGGMATRRKYKGTIGPRHIISKEPGILSPKVIP
ncbi:MAG: sporulation transcriptional regulator SpoIIID [Oscillospiraceae bacterium]